MESARSLHKLPDVGVPGRNNANSVSIMYFNARSIVPKFDELCLLVELHNPDIPLWSHCCVLTFLTMRSASRVTMCFVMIETDMEEVY